MRSILTAFLVCFVPYFAQALECRSLFRATHPGEVALRALFSDPQYQVYKVLNDLPDTSYLGSLVGHTRKGIELIFGYDRAIYRKNLKDKTLTKIADLDTRFIHSITENNGRFEVLNTDYNSIAWHSTIDAASGVLIKRSRLARPANHPGSDIFIENGVGIFESENNLIRYDFNNRQVLSIVPVPVPRGTRVDSINRIGSFYYAVGVNGTHGKIVVNRIRVADMVSEGEILQFKQSGYPSGRALTEINGRLVLSTSEALLVINPTTKKIEKSIPVRYVLELKANSEAGMVDLVILDKSLDISLQQYGGTSTLMTIPLSTFAGEVLGI